MQIRSRSFFLALATLSLLFVHVSCGGDDGERSGTDKDTVSFDTQGDGADAGVDVAPGDVDDHDADVTPPDAATDADDTDGGGEVVDPGEFQFVDCGDLPAPASGDCDVEKHGNALLIRGDVLGVDAVYEGGQVLLDASGVIVCVGCDCSADAADLDPTVVTCADAVVSPGLINAHEHITFGQHHPADWGDERYEHRNQWRKGKDGHTKISTQGNATKEETTWCEMRHVVSGATSVAGSGTAYGFLRNLDRDAQEGLDEDVLYKTFPLGDSDGKMIDDGCDYDWAVDHSALEHACFLPHVSEGINHAARNEFLCLSTDDNGGKDLTEANSAFIHAIGMLAVDGAELAVNGTSVVWSPRTNISLYGNTAPVTMFDRQGVIIALGTDWSLSGSMNVVRELQCAAYLNETHFDHHFSTREIWMMATANAAMVLAADDSVGLLAPGLHGDIAIYARGGEADPFAAVVWADTEDMLLVLRGGLPLYGDVEVMADIPGGDEGCEEIPGGVCGAARAICAKRETGWSFAELTQENSGAYDLFFCGVPDGEPSCVPMRQGEYLGEITDEDPDGDGLMGDADNCPAVFNPIRPIDEGAQGDGDGDGLGDACDPCPMAADITDCPPPASTKDDWDLDGVKNFEDNCPKAPNEDQQDTDGDAIGDVCDACPEFPNPEGMGCPSTIYAVRLGEVPLDAVVLLEGVVTALTDQGFFMQVPEAAHDAELGARYSGVYVYAPAVTTVTEGAHVELSGAVADWWGQAEIMDVTDVTMLEAVPAPAPIVVTPAAVATDGEDAEAYEGVLVSSEGAVTELNPPAKQDQGDQDPTNEFVLDDALRVNDFIFLADPMPDEGDYVFVTGVLHFANGDMKLEPRRAEDIGYGMKLKGFGPPMVFVDEGMVEAETTPPLTVELSTAAPAGGVQVTLVSDDPGVITVPESVMIPEGASSAPVLVSALATSTGPVGLTASLDDVTLGAEVTVVAAGQIPMPVAVDPPAPTVMVGQALSLSISLDIPARAGGTEVILILADGGDAFLSVPPSVTVPEGLLMAAVDLTGVAEGATTLTVSTASGDLEVSVEVVALPMPGLVLSEVLYDTSGDDTGYEWVEIYNGSPDTIDLSGYSLGSGGTDWAITVMQLQGSLEPGQCFVVGGPNAEDKNSDPVFDQAADFDPDLQNSGDKADGVALFDVPANQIAPATVPIDVVLYGGSNGSGLIDETGAAAPVDAEDVPANHSVERVGEAWQMQAAPTPNDCSAVLAL